MYLILITYKNILKINAPAVYSEYE